MDFLERADAVRRPERFRALLLAYQLSNYENADIRGDIEHMARALSALTAVKFDANVKEATGGFAKIRARELKLEALSSL
ncbi:MAG: hypothetical protein F4Y58_00920 [Gammaproteobacteria bacterium]|nr:hypothetical protein [Gammaproteobacteria bacterium]